MRQLLLGLALAIFGCARAERPQNVSDRTRRESVYQKQVRMNYESRLRPLLGTFLRVARQTEEFRSSGAVQDVLVVAGVFEDCLAEGLQAKLLTLSLERQRIAAIQSGIQAIRSLERRPLLPHDPEVNRSINLFEREVLAYLRLASRYAKAKREAVRCIGEEIGKKECDADGVHYCPP